MGIVDVFRSISYNPKNRSISLHPPYLNASSSSNDAVMAVVTEVDGKVGDCSDQTLKERVPDLARYQNIRRILTDIRKFVVESSVTEPSKRFTDRVQLHKMVWEGFESQAVKYPCDDKGKPDLSTVIEDMEAKKEKLPKEMNDVKEPNKVSLKEMKRSETIHKIPPEPIKETDFPKANNKRVMIRSRL
ncbi:hypothetical protein Nepgr_027368 [Nepenthes gracilis]|uniref:Uncharacterized protein n=1 Tax=Nepenthes gracilis TaxID=150966 RepID=A0AAD3T9R1_NEPGR|nr:hypothetical protein Nepgr_027368 [Nepenthes gracilis]